MCLGVPGQILQRLERDGLPMAVVDFGGVRREVCLAYVPQAREGDWVMVHVGFALHLLDPREAERLLRDWQVLLELEALQTGSGQDLGAGTGPPEDGAIPEVPPAPQEPEGTA